MHALSRINQADESNGRSISYQDHPGAIVGLVVGLGLAMWAMRARRSSRSSHASLTEREPRPPLRERSVKVAHLISTWQHISDALLGVATAKAVEAIAQHVPGFMEQYERQTGMRSGPSRSREFRADA